jgi:hypothetical protein
MVPVTPLGKFKRRPLLYRYLYKTELLLGSLPMVIVTPVVGAIVAAAVAARAPDHEVVRHGEIIDRSSYLHVFGVAAAGALAGVGVVLVLAFLWNVWAYRSRTDPSFATKWGLNPKPLRDLNESPKRRRQTHLMPTVFLDATDIPPLDPATTLGPVTGIALLPDRSLMEMLPPGVAVDSRGLWFHPIRQGVAVAPEGRYEIRWYGRWRNHDYEIGRSVHDHRWPKSYTPAEIAVLNAAAERVLVATIQREQRGPQQPGH